MSVCVQPVELPGGDRTWTVLGADHGELLALRRHPQNAAPGDG